MTACLTRPADPAGDDLAAAVRQLNDLLAAEADRYSRWADELAADGLPAGAELARRMADHLELIVGECQPNRRNSPPMSCPSDRRTRLKEGKNEDAY